MQVSTFFILKELWNNIKFVVRAWHMQLHPTWMVRFKMTRGYLQQVGSKILCLCIVIFACCHENKQEYKEGPSRYWDLVSSLYVYFFVFVSLWIKTNFKFVATKRWLCSEFYVANLANEISIIFLYIVKSVPILVTIFWIRFSRVHAS